MAATAMDLGQRCSACQLPLPLERRELAANRGSRHDDNQDRRHGREAQQFTFCGYSSAPWRAGKPGFDGLGIARPFPDSLHPRGEVRVPIERKADASQRVVHRHPADIGQ